MRLFVDTSVLVDHLRGDDRASELLIGAVDAGHELWSSTLVRMVGGDAPGRGTGDVVAPARSALARRHGEVADLAAQLARAHHLGPAGVETTDFVLAASAQQLDAELVTRNVRRFPTILHLEPPY